MAMMANQVNEKSQKQAQTNLKGKRSLKRDSLVPFYHIIKTPKVISTSLVTREISTAGHTSFAAALIISTNLSGTRTPPKNVALELVG